MFRKILGADLSIVALAALSSIAFCTALIIAANIGPHPLLGALYTLTVLFFMAALYLLRSQHLHKRPEPAPEPAAAAPPLWMLSEYERDRVYRYMGKYWAERLPLPDTRTSDDSAGGGPSNVRQLPRRRALRGQRPAA